MIGAELMRLIALIIIIYSTPVFAGQTVATWYGNEHAGKRTASGERFNPNGLTAAHRSLPFGTCLRVSNPKSGRSVSVRINDRGPFTKGVSLDLSHGAARAIGMSSTQNVNVGRC
jgi:peptidoglycan lytic transglycosylase